MTIRAEDVDGMDVRVLAGAIGQFCRDPWMEPRFTGTDWQKLAAGLLGALELPRAALLLYGSRYADGNRSDEVRYRYEDAVQVIRDIARAMIQAGANLEEVLTCSICGEDMEYEYDGTGNYFCPHCRDCAQTGKGI